MQSEEDIQYLLRANDRRVELNRNHLGMLGVPITNLLVGRVRDDSPGIATSNVCYSSKLAIGGI